MKIGELSKQSGLTSSRIRFYEARGLLNMVSRTSNGYREYPPDTVLILKLIDSAQQAGFSLDEIQQLLPSDVSQWDHNELVSVLHQKIADIEALECQLAQNKLQLRSLIQQIESKPADIDCADNAKRILKNLVETPPR